MSLLVTSHATPIGALSLVAEHGALSGLYFPDHKPGGPPAAAKSVADAPEFEPARRALDAYFEGRETKAAHLRPALAGTAFQLSVWAALQEIAWGETVTYGALAARLGNPTAVRAVAGAVARNPISIFIPCHRVIGKDGTLTGYAGGIARKKALLALEGARLIAR